MLETKFAIIKRVRSASLESKVFPSQHMSHTYVDMHTHNRSLISVIINDKIDKFLGFIFSLNSMS